MAFEEGDYPGFVREISVEPWLSEASDGTVTYGPAVTYQCAIRDDVKRWAWEDATELASRRTIYVHAQTLKLKDRITLPAGYEPLVTFPVYIVRRDDDEGYHHSEIYGA
jgi:hypothetical protein